VLSGDILVHHSANWLVTVQTGLSLVLDVEVGGVLDMLWIGFWIWLGVLRDLRYFCLYTGPEKVAITLSSAAAG